MADSYSLAREIRLQSSKAREEADDDVSKKVSRKRWRWQDANGEANDVVLTVQQREILNSDSMKRWFATPPENYPI